MFEHKVCYTGIKQKGIIHGLQQTTGKNQEKKITLDNYDLTWLQQSDLLYVSLRHILKKLPTAT